MVASSAPRAVTWNSKAASSPDVEGLGFSLEFRVSRNSGRLP